MDEQQPAVSCRGFDFWWMTLMVVRPYALAGLIVTGILFEIAFHYYLRISPVYLPFYFLIVTIAGLWYGRRAVLVAVFLGGLQLVVSVILAGAVPAESLINAVMLIVVAFVAGSVADMIGCYRDMLDSKERDLHDLHERLSVSESSFAITNKKLSFLSNITRHDVKNQLTVLIGYIDLIRMEAADPVVADHIGKAMTAAQVIEHQIEFTRLYEDIGAHAPQWQEVSIIAERLRSRIPKERDISLDIRTGGLFIWADPLLEKVFENLVDNTIRHGDRVHTITISSLLYGLGDLAIVYEDDGVGIHEEDKELIFEKGTGNNQRMGLFLSREILAISGYSMKESGTYGKGVRFEIHIPKGKYRLPEKSVSPEA